MEFDQEVYEQLLAEAKEYGVHLVHTFGSFDGMPPKGGFTAAWSRDGRGPGCKMIRVSLSYCSEKDFFCRKIGAFHALVNHYNGVSVELPIGSADSGDIVNEIRLRFGL